MDYSNATVQDLLGDRESALNQIKKGREWLVEIDKALAVRTTRNNGGAPPFQLPEEELRQTER